MTYYSIGNLSISCGATITRNRAATMVLVVLVERVVGYVDHSLTPMIAEKHDAQGGILCP